MKRKIAKVILSLLKTLFLIGNFMFLMALTFFLAPYFFDAVLEAMANPIYSEKTVEALAYFPVATLSLALFWLGYWLYRIIGIQNLITKGE